MDKTLDSEHPPVQSGYTFTPQENEAEARRILDEKPQALLDWFDNQGLKPEDEREGIWATMLGQWKRRGCEDAGRLWFKEQKEAVVKTWRITARVKVASVIVRKFAEMKLANVAPVPLKRPKGSGKELEILPDTIRWVYLHPGLAPGVEDETHRALIDAYEAKYPAPDQGAVSRYWHCREEAKHRSEFFMQVDRILLEERKRLAKKPDGGVSQRKTDDPGLVDLEEEIKRMRAG